MVADHAQHVGGVGLVAGEGAELAGHLGRRGVGDAGHDGRQRTADRPAFGAVIGNARRHQAAADVGEAQAQRAVAVAELGDLLGRELRHQHRDFERDGPQPAGVLEAVDVEALVRVAEHHQVQRGEVARRVVQEHVFRARVGRADRSRLGAGVPVVDGGVELDAGIGRGPGREADFLPQVARFERLDRAPAEPRREVPVLVVDHRVQELIRHAHRVVGVLARDGQIGLAVPVGVVGRELDLLVALARELDDAADQVVGHQVAARFLDGALESRVLGGLEAGLALRLAVDAGLHDGLEPPLADLGAGHEGRDLLLLLHLPVDVGFDIGMVDVDHHHLGGPARRTAGLDGPCGAITDAQEAHQARRFAAARQLLVLRAQLGEVGAGAGAVLEQARFPHPQVHDAVLVDEIVLDRLDEAGVRLGMLVGRCRGGQLAGLVIDVEVALAGAVDAVGPVQAGVEPLRAVGRAHLHGQHVAVLVEEGARVVLAGEVAALPAPVGPGAGQAVEHLARVALARRCARAAATRRGAARRRWSATARTEPGSLRCVSGASAGRPCGSTSGRGCRRRPGSSARGPRSSRAGTRRSRRGS